MFLKLGIQDGRARDYILVEDVQMGWERSEGEEKRGGSQRILDMDEKVLLAENKWKGSGRFLLKKTNNVSSCKFFVRLFVLSPPPPGSWNTSLAYQLSSGAKGMALG
jgi:hypothetical protein